MSQRDADTFISNNVREFILKALAEECRLDGRRPYDMRKIKFQFSLDDRSATVGLGSTRVMAVVSAALEAPFPDRPSEGPLRFNVEFSPMASPAFEPGRPGEDAIQVARLVERALRQSGAVDQEALCVVAGRKVWSLRVDCHVLDSGGNLLDACCLAALAALLAFRKPEVELGGEGGTELRVLPPELREPLPLTIHHLPVAVTFALFQGGDVLLVDPSLKEAAASSGSCTLVMNPAGEVCCVHKADGIGLSTQQFMRCVRLAGERAKEVVAALKAALEQHEVARVQARIRRHQPVSGVAAGAAAEGGVMVLGAKDPAAGAAAGATLGGAALPAVAAAAAVQGGGAGGGDEDMDDDLSDDDEEEEEEQRQADGAGRADGQGGGAGAGPGSRDADMRDAAAAGSSRGKKRDSSGAAAAAAGINAGEQQQQQRARLSGPLLAAKPNKTGAKRGNGGGLQQGANQRGRDDVGFNELEAIAAVIAGVPPGGPPAGAPEPDLAAAVKPGKQRKGAAGKGAEK
ncbi:hypothetical protein Agub_g1774 [Astrephomene gubernaculifera]|uniref:Exosome complex component RRP45 n=1 Tax=Astrephomene gubernaculifera TaxID=47775 RepID=A0AAD3DG06_9CHLO|nr:hypothetical protein Agub_g1774 [Astrephomene gubernaculifera]